MPTFLKLHKFSLRIQRPQSFKLSLTCGPGLGPFTYKAGKGRARGFHDPKEHVPCCLSVCIRAGLAEFKSDISEASTFHIRSTSQNNRHFKASQNTVSGFFFVCLIPKHLVMFHMGNISASFTIWPLLSTQVKPLENILWSLESLPNKSFDYFHLSVAKSL